MSIERTIIIGDIHGCLEEFKALLEKVRFVPGTDRLILVGDLINKGPSSLGVLELAYSLQAECILGNHEAALLRYCEAKFKPERENFQVLINEMGARLEFWIDWIKTWPLYLEEDEFVVVHAGIAPEMKFSEAPIKVLTKIREWENKPWFDYYTDSKLIVYGHWASLGLKVRDNTIGLDSGCCWGGSLSGLLLPQKEIIQVKAQKAYYSDEGYNG